MGDERPERIWLLHDTDDGGGDTWCQHRNPTGEPNEDVPATEYVRADVARDREARLVAALANLLSFADRTGGSCAKPVEDARAELDAMKGGDNGDSL